jgi:hypothetical protein
MSTKTIDIKIEGLRDGQQLSPDLLDVDEVVNLLSYARDFLFPEKNKSRGRVSVAIKEGSAVLSLDVDTGTAVQAQAILGQLNAEHNLSLLESKQAEAIEAIQKFVREQNFVLQFGMAGKLDEGLRMDRETEWIAPEDIWVDEELYVSGEIVDVGGKTKSNVHIDTEEFGTLTVAAEKDTLSEDDKNRLYKKQQLRIRIKRNLNTGEFKKGSAELIEFIDFDDGREETAEAYLDRLIAEAKPHMDKIKDPDEWLKNVRGYEG